MAFRRKINDIIELVFGKESVRQRTITDITFYKLATFPVNVLGNRSEITGVGQQIQNYDLYFRIFRQHVFNEVRTNKTSGSSNQISLHVYDFRFII